ncbi:DUF1764-domain-containing protein [Guyanagaster necrorhizus]|uniref:DUF1764-domain-containing protein n=1 Tax=Guyanagaster necrorhizus TaxID=856835 RepID=A0A9P7W0I3_9AGAR|nr:DUF1764-domain-containing protein [Guyanagaster necrorhizus MCA 3950]KAG7450362.1 DUF1764-domain-containing protein [Guyanagaster necrorhizus MCA 3950]
MPISEIDDIFAAKRSLATSSSTSHTVKKSKKRRRDHPTNDHHEPPSKKRVPQTVIDPSATNRINQTKRSDRSNIKSFKSGKGSKADEERFKDSRGSGPRRKTEEGWSVYKEDELGMINEGGDTPSCPFDCDCCESFY